MITCDLIGQTGNQQFQIATLYALALDNNDNWAIPEHSMNKQEWPLHYKNLPTIPFDLHRNLPTTYRELGFPYRKIPYSPGMKLHGYFQCEKYFSHRRKEVIALFKREWKPFLPLRNTVGVHVRRGDYLKYPTKHPSPSVNWIKEAMLMMSSASPIEKRGEPYKFLFFSDDIDWCKDNFPCNQYSEGRSALEDMSLLSSCEHQIISASTFGWWGAWMNENPEKLVIAPAVWFGPGNRHLDYRDIVPETWVKL